MSKPDFTAHEMAEFILENPATVDRTRARILAQELLDLTARLKIAEGKLTEIAKLPRYDIHAWSNCGEGDYEEVAAEDGSYVSAYSLSGILERKTS